MKKGWESELNELWEVGRFVPPPPNEIINLGKCLTDLLVQNFTPTQLIKEISR